MTKPEDYTEALQAKVQKAGGIYYTPEETCRAIIDRYVKLTTDSKVLEPGCGCGHFARLLFKNFQDLGVDSKTILADNLKLIENDKGATQVLASALDVSVNSITSASFLQNLQMEKNLFDYIIGNPPYAAKLSDEDKKYCERNFADINENGKRMDSSGYFLRKSIDLLKPGGRLIFVLPATLLRVASYKGLREFILKTSYVREVIDLRRIFDDVGYETVALVLDKKGPGVIPQPVQTLTDIKSPSFEEFDTNICRYEFYESRPIFSMFLNPIDENILTKCETGVCLNDFSTMPRGFSISSNDESLHENSVKGLNIPLLFGRDMGKYRLHQPRRFIPWPNSSLSKIHQRHQVPKILVQNLAYRVVATDDAEGHLISDTINTLFVDEERFPRHYVLGIINSNLMTYYFQMVLTNRAKLNIHMDHPYLGKLPIKETTAESQNKVVGWVKKLLKEPENKSVREELEAEVFRIYGLDEDEQERVLSWPIFGRRNR